jgi:uncharacterized Zn-binding protein involved in type VI secretion
MRRAAARQTDETAHGGEITLGEPTVLIGGEPAARVGDNQTCKLSTEAGVAHVGGAITSGSQTVLIGGKKAARVGDSCDCVFGPDAPEGAEGIPNTIATGEATVLIG